MVGGVRCPAWAEAVRPGGVEGAPCGAQGAPLRDACSFSACEAAAPGSSPRLRIPIPERRAWRPLSFALAPSETERSSADEDDDAEADQDDGEQDVFPALEDFSDRRPGGNELGDYDQDRDEREEDEAVGDHCDGFHAEEDGDIDADVVSAVGEGDSCDGPRADLRARDLGVIVVIVSAPGLPCSPETEGQGDEPEVRDSC